MKLLAALTLLASCGHHDDGKPCANGTAHLAIMRVDDASKYMIGVYKHVGSDHDNKPTDPDAIAAGVVAEIDTWRSPEKKAGMELDRRVDYCLISHDRAALEKYIGTLPPVPSDRKIVIEHEPPIPDAKDRREYWRTYYVIATPLVDQTAIAAAMAIDAPDETTRHARLSVKLTTSGQAAFGEATSKNVGHKLATIVDDDVIAAPIIMGPITGGSFQLQMETMADANDLLKRLGCS